MNTHLHQIRIQDKEEIVRGESAQSPKMAVTMVIKY